MNLEEKLKIAQMLAELQVDVIEAGFPIASPGDFEAVREVATQIKGPVICGLARCNDADIDRAWEALAAAERSRIHVFLATSAIHREFKLRWGKRKYLIAQLLVCSEPQVTVQMSNFLQKTQPAPKSIFSAALSKPRLKPGRPRSIFQIRWVMRRQVIWDALFVR